MQEPTQGDSDKIENELRDWGKKNKVIVNKAFLDKFWNNAYKYAPEDFQYNDYSPREKRRIRADFDYRSMNKDDKKRFNDDFFN